MSLTGMSATAAKEVRGPEAAEMQKVLDYIKANPNANIVYNITGGSKGIIVTSTEKKQRTSPSQFKNVTGEKFAIGQILKPSQILDQKDPVKNVVYYTNDQLGGVYIELKREPYREINDGVSIRSTIDLIVEDIYDEKGKLLNGYDKIAELQKTLNVNNVNGIKITVDRDTKEFTLSLNDWSDQNFGVTTVFDLSNDDGKMQARIALQNYLEANAYQKNYPVSEANFNNKAYEENKNLYRVELNEETGRRVLLDSGVSYIDYLKNNMSLTAVPNTESGNIVTSNSFFTLQLSDDSTTEVFEEKKKEQEKEEVVVEIKKEIDTTTQEPSNDVSDDELFRTLDVRNRSKQATQKQIEDAEAWYNQSELSKYIPFKGMFDLVNSKNPDAVASWATSGITLFKGSDFSDLYHEAWHGFTQTFMTKDQKKSLYSEVRKKSGNFMDHNGNRVRFTKATDLQIEEYLAESFRNYMLSDQKALKGSPKQNSF